MQDNAPRLFGPYGGLRIIERADMTDPVEDWSSVRSPSRARRRMKAGHPQRVRIIHVPKKEAYQMGNTLVMHPVMAAELRRQMAAQEGEGSNG